SRWSSIGGAVAFALNGAFAWFSHAPVNAIPFLPLLLLGIELAYTASSEERRGGWWLIAVAGALSIYAGFYEVAYVDGLMAVFWLTVGGYLSTSLLVLGMLGVAGKGRRGLKVALLAWIVLALTRMFGGPAPLNEVLGVLPGMSRVAFFRYAPASVSLALVVLA